MLFRSQQPQQQLQQPQQLQVENNIQDNIQNNTQDNINTAPTNNKNKLVLYYALWCGHSRNFLPIWDQVRAVIENSPDLNTECIQYDCEAQKQSCQGVNGFPSVVLIKQDGTIIQYNQSRTPEALLTFVNANKI